jgi:hypothetical protein
MALATVTTRTTYLVRDSEDRLVVAFWGAMAEDEAALWAERDGFRIELRNDLTF